jgi:WD40 repeat protein
MPAERTTVLSLAYSEEENILICGSRESALLIYRLPCHTTVPEETIQTLKPTLQLRKSHGKQAITSVLIKKTQDTDDTQDDRDEITADEDDNEEGDQVIFWTAGRDGCYVQYRLRILNNNNSVQTDKTQLGIANQGDTVFTGNDLVLEKLYRNKITKGTLEGSLLMDGELLLMGFFRKNFFVYNEKKNFVTVSINCGGGHRRWGFSTEDAKLNKSAFAFIRKEVLYAYFRDTSSVTDGFNESILQGNYHGREVRALRFLPLLSQDVILFATSGEDTILRIQQYTPETVSKFHTHVSIRKHTTVIKNIDYSQGLSTLLFTSGGLEEFRCWKIEASPPKTVGGLVNLNCLEVATCPTLSVDIESRIMDTTAFAIDPKKGLHIIGAVYSDAMIRFWLFNEVTRKFCLVADGTWHAKCILQITHVKLGDKIYFFTSATDGRVAVWDIDYDLRKAVESYQQLEAEPTKAAFRLSEPIYFYSAHMSGVNALEAVQYQGLSSLKAPLHSIRYLTILFL